AKAVTAADEKPSSRTSAADSVLSVSDLRVEFPGGVRPVRGVSFTVGRGEAVGGVGEAGSGKSLTALAGRRLREAPAQVSAGRLSLLGQDLLGTAQDDPGQRGPGQRGTRQRGTRQRGTRQRGTRQRGTGQRGSGQRGPDQRGTRQRGTGAMTGRELRRFL